MNLWMWDSQLQFSNYSENNLKMAVLQLVHVILIIAELWLLMQLGRTLKRHRLCRTRVVTNLVSPGGLWGRFSPPSTSLEEPVLLQRPLKRRFPNHPEYLSAGNGLHYRHGDLSAG